MLHLLRRDRLGTPAALLTTVNAAAGRVAMHGVRLEVLQAQADAADLPLWTVPLPYPCSNEKYERLMADVVARAAGAGFTHVAFGDLFLEDVRAYREHRLEGTGLAPLFPLWKRDTATLAGEMIDGGLEATLTCVDPRVLDRAFAGRAFDRVLLDGLPDGVDPCGERGEFHTCVTAGPMFSRGIETRPGEVVERDGFVFADVVLAGRSGELQRHALRDQPFRE
jgi:uncharacterized protein (TIGR00290 family)